MSIFICSRAVFPLGGCAFTARTCACQYYNNTNELLLLGRRRRRHTYSTLGQHLRPFVLKKAHHRNDGRWCRCSFLTFGTSMLQLVDLHLDCEEVYRLEPGCFTTRFPGHLRSGKKKRCTGNARAGDLRHVGALMADHRVASLAPLCVGDFRNSVIRRGSIGHYRFQKEGKGREGSVYQKGEVNVI